MGPYCAPFLIDIFNKDTARYGGREPAPEHDPSLHGFSPFLPGQICPRLCFICLLVFGIAPRLTSQALAAETASAPAATPAPSPAGTLSRQDAEQLLSVLNDPKSGRILPIP